MSKFIPYVILLLLISGCKTSKHTLNDLKEKEAFKIINNIERKQIDYKTLDIKARAFVKNEDLNQNLSVDIKIAHDSLIWASAKMIGLEVGRLFIDRHGITIIDRINRNYSRYPMEYISKTLGIPYADFQSLQNLLTAYLLFTPDPTYEIYKDSLSIIFTKTIESLKQSLIISSGTLELSGYHFDYPQSDQRAKITYRDKIKHNKYEIPKIIEIWAYLPDENYLKLNYFSARFNEAIEFDTAIPNGYIQAD